MIQQYMATNHLLQKIVVQTRIFHLDCEFKLLMKKKKGNDDFSKLSNKMNTRFPSYTSFSFQDNWSS